MDLIPDNEYYHSMFGDDETKCPAWFGVGWAICMMLVMGSLGYVLISMIF